MWLKYFLARHAAQGGRGNATGGGRTARANQRSQRLSYFKPLPVPNTLTTDTRVLLDGLRASKLGKEQPASLLAFEEDFMADPVADPWESEAGELFRNFQRQSPSSKRLSVEETNYITRFVRDNPDLTISKATGVERFQAKQCLLPDGRLLIVCKVKPNATGSHFYISRGLFLRRFSENVHRHKGEPRLAFFIPGTPEYEALKRGKIVFAFTRMGRAEQVFQFDYNLTDHGNIVRRMQEMTEQTDDILRNEPGCVYDHELVRAEATNIELCKEHVTREDWLQVGWLKELKARLQNTLRGVLELKTEPAIALEDEELKKHRPDLSG